MAKVDAPPPRDYYGETAATLKAQVDLAPKVYANEAKYGELYALLGNKKLEASLNGGNGQRGLLDIYENDLYPSMSRIQEQSDASQREGDIAAIEKLSGFLGGLWGVFCCQCRRGPDGVARFFEINPRFGGGAPLSVAAGANLPLYLIQEVLGMPITAKVGDFTDRLLMLRYDDAVFVQVTDPRKLPGYDTPHFR